jgi:short-subunit dehydrogenase
LACRSEERGLSAEKDIREKSGNGEVHFMQVDLSSQASIREFSKIFHEKEKKLHVLVGDLDFEYS